MRHDADEIDKQCRLASMRIKVKNMYDFSTCVKLAVGSQIWIGIRIKGGSGSRRSTNFFVVQLYSASTSVAEDDMPDSSYTSSSSLGQNDGHLRYLILYSIRVGFTVIFCGGFLYSLGTPHCEGDRPFHLSSSLLLTEVSLNNGIVYN
jgi:hypothetical protein